MTLLHVAFQEGFFDDEVVIQLNNEEVFRKQGVKTRLQIALADSFDLEVSVNSATVVISLPKKGVSNSIRLSLSSPVYLGVSITSDNKIIFKPSTTPFGYM